MDGDARARCFPYRCDLSSDSGPSDSDYDALSTLTVAPEPIWRARDLAAPLLWSTSRLAHHVGRMERRGLVARDACSDDGRGATVALTEDGWKALREAAPLHVESVRRHFIDLLTPTEIKALAAISTKVLTHLDEHGGE